MKKFNLHKARKKYLQIKEDNREMVSKSIDAFFATHTGKEYLKSNVDMDFVRGLSNLEHLRGG